MTDRFIVKVSDFGTSALLDLGSSDNQDSHRQRAQRIRFGHSLSQEYGEKASELMVCSCSVHLLTCVSLSFDFDFVNVFDYDISIHSHSTPFTSFEGVMAFA